MNSRLIYFIIVFVLFSGCVQYDYSQEIREDGTSKITMTVDYKQKIIADSAAIKEDYKKTLDDFIKEKRERCKKIETEYNASCIVDGPKIIISKEASPDDGFYSFKLNENFNQKEYFIEIYAIPFIDYPQEIEVNEINLQKMDLEPEIIDQIKKNSGIDAKYTIYFPGKLELIETNLSGMVYENKLVFDMFEIAKNPSEIKIISKKTNNEYVYFIVVLVIILFLIFTYFIIRQNKRKNG